MKKIVLIIIAAFISSAILAQKDSSDKMFTVDQVPASFPGGYEGWNNYLTKNLNAELGVKYIRAKKGQKTVTQTAIVSFTVDTSGRTSNIKVENFKKVHPKLAEEAIRVIKEGPNWIPAELHGKKVKYLHRQSITWQVSEE